ncbi:MAG TPA: hypothetical protein VHW94_02300 [Candidatus Dormibacteraeota bacterium]|nr:hypothetical protein [Candidatus Dormibacteraeota bacterium]
MKGWMWFLTTLVGAAISLAGLLIGAWWLTFVAGLVIGAIIGQARVAVPAGALAGLAAWGLGLAVLQVDYGLGPSARSLAAIMGFTGQAAVPLILTCLVGLLLDLTGAWLASALRGFLVPATR